MPAASAAAIASLSGTMPTCSPFGSNQDARDLTRNLVIDNRLFAGAFAAIFLNACLST